MSEFTATAASGQEVTLSKPPVSLMDVGDTLYRAHHFGQFPDNRQSVTLRGSHGFVIEGGQPFASLAYHDDAHWRDRGRTHGVLLGVERAVTHRLTRFIKRYPTVLPVLDIPIDTINDPSIASKSISPANLLYTASLDDAVQLGSWVVDAGVRSQVSEWTQKRPTSYAERLAHEHWLTLRAAPHVRDDQHMSVARDSGRYSYRNIRDDVVGENLPTVWDPQELKSVPVKAHGFTEEDLEWLNTYMATLGLPIPQD